MSRLTRTSTQMFHGSSQLYLFPRGHEPLGAKVSDRNRPARTPKFSQSERLEVRGRHHPHVASVSRRRTRGASCQLRVVRGLRVEDDGLERHDLRDAALELDGERQVVLALLERVELRGLELVEDPARHRLLVVERHDGRCPRRPRVELVRVPAERPAAQPLQPRVDVQKHPPSLRLAMGEVVHHARQLAQGRLLRRCVDSRRRTQLDLHVAERATHSPVRPTACHASAPPPRGEAPRKSTSVRGPLAIQPRVIVRLPLPPGHPVFAKVDPYS